MLRIIGEASDQARMTSAASSHLLGKSAPPRNKEIKTLMVLISLFYFQTLRVSQAALGTNSPYAVTHNRGCYANDGQACNRAELRKVGYEY